MSATNAAAPAPRAKSEQPRRRYSFRELIDAEYQRLDHAKEPASSPHEPPVVSPPGIADEPWVSFTDRDLFGLALSGGGIRSATFNLGLLQALERKRLLKDVDYVSTVSGGGYLGGFWTAWRQITPPSRTTGAASAHAFPAQQNPVTPSVPGLPDTREPAPIRHLREFSRFLMPRVGFFHTETWDGIVAICGGLLPALLATAALVALALYAWFAGTVWLVLQSSLVSAGLVALLTGALHIFLEGGWRRSGKSGAADQEKWRYTLLAILSTLLTAFFWYHWHDQPALEKIQLAWLEKIAAAWTPEHVRIEPAGPEHASISAVPFGLALVWVATTLALLVLRGVTARAWRSQNGINWSGTIDRVAARHLAPAVIWSGFAALWEISHWLLDRRLHWQAAGAAGAGTAGAGALFIQLRDWLGKPAQETNASSLLRKLAGWLKPLAPQALANLAVVCLFVGVCLLVQYGGTGRLLWPALLTASLIIFGTLLVFDPARIGLHDFYRARICRCYLGAARAQEYPNYSHPTVEQPDDDLTLADLRDQAERPRPIHLVCTTANNLAGDVLGSLYRGGRSAVVSPHGLSLGAHTASLDQLRLSSALTASAAAFNSQMGSLSVNLGPAVSFLMCAFNLRLGLWAPHPLNPNEKLVFKGVPFFLEMFGQTDCDPPPPTAASDTTLEKIRNLPLGNACAFVGEKYQQAGQRVDELNRSVHMLHLSDGGHFENLALYELVRRHCRYVIVSDCGADPQVAFDDLANAQRLVREDFGVEIDLDVTPLRPDAAGRARQHAVVGTIHYDGYDGTDKGTIIYFKPALTGDEPPDVLQYQARNTAFPHEGTGDQFYDAAQWESYRRLGEHAGNVVFRYLEKVPPDKAWRQQFVENAFLEATQRWHPSPERLTENFLALTERCAELEAAVRDEAPAGLRAEFFPEVGAVLQASPPAASTPEDEVRTVYFLMLVAQVMEDAWLAADLENNWSHPLNEGWMNYLQRWASTPSFRRWWPVLRPLYSPAFRDFVRDRFQIVIKDSLARQEPAIAGAELVLRQLPANDARLQGFAWQEWQRRQPAISPAELGGFFALDYRLSLAPDRHGARGEPIQVGFLLYRDASVDGIVSFQWHSAHLFVPHALVGAGIVARLLDAAVHHFKSNGNGKRTELSVLLDEDSAAPAARGQPDPASRLQRVRTINFYKSRGFVHTSPDGNGARLLRLKV